MSRYTRKVQVFLTEEQYRDLADIAANEQKKIGVVVREALEQICLRKARAQEKAQAIRELLSSTEETQVPQDYEEWEEQYLREKYVCND